MRLPLNRLAFVAAALLGASCGSSENNDGGPGNPDGGTGNMTDGGTAVPDKLVWNHIVVDEDNAGFQPEIARSPSGRLSIAYFRRRGTVNIMCRAGISPVDQWEVVYAEESNDFQPVLVTAQPLVALLGLSLAFDDRGEPAIAVMGDGMMPSQARCGGSDVLLFRRSGGTWASSVIDGSGMGTPYFMEDRDACTRYQDACNKGDTVGPWPALVFVGADPVLVYRDIHFGFAQDDEDKSDIELQWGGRHDTLDATWGAGIYTRMVLDAMGNPILVHFNKSQTEYGSGIWSIRWNGSMWVRSRVSTEDEVGFRLGLAATNGKVGVAYHASGQQKLYYQESPDGTDWSAAAELVDQSGNTGQSPSLAYDGAGNPAISYYRCGRYMAGTNDCEQGRDGLRFAVRRNGTWEAVDVKADDNGRDGVNTALVFDSNGLPAIAYQATYFDPATREVIRQMVLARGRKQ